MSGLIKGLALAGLAAVLMIPVGIILLAVGIPIIAVGGVLIGLIAALAAVVAVPFIVVGSIVVALVAVMFGLLAAVTGIALSAAQWVLAAIAIVFIAQYAGRALFVGPSARKPKAATPGPVPDAYQLAAERELDEEIRVS